MVIARLFYHFYSIKLSEFNFEIFPLKYVKHILLSLQYLKLYRFRFSSPVKKEIQSVASFTFLFLNLIFIDVIRHICCWFLKIHEYRLQLLLNRNIYRLKKYLFFTIFDCITYQPSKPI